MANIGKIATKAIVEVKGDLLTKCAKTPEQFSAVLKKDLKMKEPPKLDEFKKVVTINEAKVSLKKIAPKLAKEPPLWKKVIGKIFG